MMNICLDSKYTKNFVYGAGASVNRAGSKNCQLFLAEQCARDPSRGCLDLPQQDMYLPGFDLFGRRIQQNQRDAYIRNVALATYIYTVPNCPMQTIALDPQSTSNLSVNFWNNCQPILAMTPSQIELYKTGQDKILPRLLFESPKFDDVLINLKTTLMAFNLWDTLKGTQFWEWGSVMRAAPPAIVNN